MSPATSRRRITKSIVDGLKPGEIAWDSETKGFGVRCQRKAKVFLVKYRAGGKQRWLVIGQHGSPWTAETARKKAKAILGEVAAGRDPAEARDGAKRDLTVAELCDLYLAEGCTTKKPTTLATDRGRIERHIKTLLGRKKVRDVKRADIERLLSDVAAGKTATDEKTGPRGRAIVTGGKGTATKTVSLLGAIFTFAIDRELCADNPAHGTKTFKTRKMERFLSPAELARLGDALASTEKEGADPFAIAAIRFLALSGCRKSEALTLRWQPDPDGAGYVDFERGCLHLAESKTGSKVVPLGAPALELLASLPRIEGNPHVFPGKTAGRHFIGLQKVWTRLRERADLAGVRIHDLRHGFASVAVAGGDSLFLVGKVLGHRQAGTTERYAHLADDPVRAVADRAARQIASAMTAKTDGSEVVSFPQGKT